MNTEIEVKIGKIIKKFRTKNNISQTELGDALGVVHTTISRYETGKIDIPLSKLSEISEYLGFEPKEYINAFYNKETIRKALRTTFSNGANFKQSKNIEKLENEIMDSLSDASVEYIIAVSNLISESENAIFKDKLTNDSIKAIISTNKQDKSTFSRLMAYYKAFKNM